MTMPWAETTIGLYKNECVRADLPFRRGPLRNLGDVELITVDYVPRYNQQRLMHRPAESHQLRPRLATMPSA